MHPWWLHADVCLKQNRQTVTIIVTVTETVTVVTVTVTTKTSVPGHVAHIYGYVAASECICARMHEWGYFPCVIEGVIKYLQGFHGPRSLKQEANYSSVWERMRRALRFSLATEESTCAKLALKRARCWLSQH